MTMKTKSFVWVVMGLMTAVLTIPEINFAQAINCERYWTLTPQQRRQCEREEFARRRSLGTWYLNGDGNQPCQISFLGSGFEAKNERGDTTRLVYIRYRDNGMSIQAIDWEGGLRGEVHERRFGGQVHQSIEWANGTRWKRVF
jgi:hypothetical protein